MIVVAGACGGEGDLSVPTQLDGGVMIQVDRTAENDLAATMAKALKDMGFEETVAGVYEYDFLPDKPVYFLAAGRGRAGDKQALMDQALSLLGGENGTTEPPAEMEFEGVTFLCAPYSHTGVLGTVGTGGLASISAVCTWSDETGGGFAVWVAGPSVEDTLKRTAEARKAMG
jgi:hypothetical protein